MIAIVDYRAGNLASVRKALNYLGAESAITADPHFLRRADKVILPGVGHFSATAELARTGMRRAIQEHIAHAGPFLGICAGMQWMLTGSSEAPDVPGLGVITAASGRFCAPGLKVPHVGWNRITKLRDSLLLNGVGSGAFVYFSHSYCAPMASDTVAVSEYGAAFSAAVERESMFGVQFHPEKSGEVGLQVLKNFVES